MKARVPFRSRNEFLRTENKEASPFLFTSNTQRRLNPRTKGLKVCINQFRCIWEVNQAVNELYVSIPHYEISEREWVVAPQWPLGDGEDQRQHGRSPPPFCSKAAIVSIRWLPALS